MPASTILSYPLSMRTSGSGSQGDHRVTFQSMKARMSSTADEPGDMVAMYLPPDALKTSYTQNYSEADIGGAGVAIAAGDTGEAEKAFNSAMKGELGGAIDALKGASGGGNSIMNAMATSVAKEVAEGAGAKLGTAVQALERKVGKIRNHHKAIIYQGPGGFRTFSFSFVMMPKSKEEADEVNKIVHFFKYHMHPDVTGSASSQTQVGTRGTGLGNPSTSLTLSYPDEFKIRISPRGRGGDADVGSTSLDGRPRQVKPLFKMEKCFLKDLSVDYATSGQPVFFDDGSEPVTTSLQLGFQETQLITRESIRQGF